jgi:hypothetical protein
VTIPPIASDAAISVDRGDPGVQVSYQMPDGQQWTDSSAISGQDSPVEVLHLDNLTSAETGTWTIKLTATSGLASQLVGATAFWQGAVRAVMTADPPIAGLGQPITVTLSVLGPNGPITDSSTLSRLQVGVRVSGDGQTGSTPVPVTNAGEAPGSPTGVGEYKGTFTAPQTSGVLTFTGRVAGYGLYSTEAPATVQVGENIPGFTATVQPPLISSVQAGASIQGQVSFVNQSGAPRKVRLELNVSHALAVITSRPGLLTVMSGSPPTAPFTITFSKNSPIGSAWLEVKAVDAANPGLVYSDATFILTVTSPQGFRAAYNWVIIAIIVPLLLLLLLPLVWLWRRKVDVRGLIAILHRNGERVDAELMAPSGKWSNTFRFIIEDPGQASARLDYSKGGQSENAYTLWRARRGKVKLRTPAGTRYDIVVGGAREHLEQDGLALAFRDTRPRRGAMRPAAPQVDPGGTDVLDSTGQSGPQTANDRGTISQPPASAQPDPWI